METLLNKTITIEEIETKSKKTSIYTLEELKKVNYQAYMRIIKEYQYNISKEHTAINYADIKKVEELVLHLKQSDNYELFFTENGAIVCSILKNSKNSPINFNKIITSIKESAECIQFDYSLNMFNFKTNELLKEKLNKTLNIYINDGLSYAHTRTATIADNNLSFTVEIANLEFDDLKVYNINIPLNN